MIRNTLILILILIISIQELIAKALDKKKPNIIVFIADDASRDFGCYGNPCVKTPNIDQLAAKGVQFNNAFVTAPQSSPSRISMMTGVFAHTLGVEDLHTPIDDKTRIIPSYLKEAGYYTGCLLKTHWGDFGTKQFDFSFSNNKDLYYESYMTSTNKFFLQYRKFLDQAGNKPFFMWVGFIDPHRPYKEPQTKNVHQPNQVVLPPTFVDGPGSREDLVDYYNEIHRLDQHVGFMLAELERRGVRDNTVVIFLSDNGMPFQRAKGFLYDSGTRIPLIVSWPGVTKEGAHHSNGLVSGVDMAPTLLDIAGIPVPETMYGKSFLSLIKDPAARGNEAIFTERNWHNTEEYCRSIRTEKYKLIYNGFPNTLAAIIADMRMSPAWYELLEGKRAGTLNSAQSQLFQFPRPVVELYDVVNDPYELNNLAGKAEYLKTATSLMKQLLDWQKATKDTKPGDRKKEDDTDRMSGFPIGGALLKNVE